MGRHLGECANSSQVLSQECLLQDSSGGSLLKMPRLNCANSVPSYSALFFQAVRRTHNRESHATSVTRGVCNLYPVIGRPLVAYHYAANSPLWVLDVF